MGYITARKARILAQLAQVQATLTNLYAAMLEMATAGTSSYAFDSGEGSQKTTRRSYDEIQGWIDRLEAKERHLFNELYGMGIINVRLRRKNNSRWTSGRPC